VNISIVIPTSNHPELLKRSLAALDRACAPHGAWEVLVVDNSGEAFRSQNAKATAAFNQERFRYCPMPQMGLMAARHHGVELARMEIVSFIDDDSLVRETWLQGLEGAFEDPGVALVGGPNYPEYEVWPPAWLEYFWDRNEWGKHLGYLSLLDFGTEPKDIPATFVWGCDYSIRKNVFQKVRGSHPDYLPAQWRKYQGDGEVGLSVKVEASGYRARYVPECAINHLVPAVRMTREYLGNRAHFVGLHSSFTEIRRRNGLGPMQGVTVPVTTAPGPCRQLRAWASRTWMGKVKRSLFNSSKLEPREPTEVAEIRQYLKGRFDEGWAFHQQAVQEDPSLLEYVLRPNFMGENARIPGGGCQ